MHVLPESHKDGVPFLMHNDLLRQDGLGADLLLHQVVFAHKHPVGELFAVGHKHTQAVRGFHLDAILNVFNYSNAYGARIYRSII